MEEKKRNATIPVDICWKLYYDNYRYKKDEIKIKGVNMKTKTINKLAVKKETIARLNTEEMDFLRGGYTTFISITCPSWIYVGEDLCVTIAK
jgi:natural product precursor